LIHFYKRYYKYRDISMTMTLAQPEGTPEKRRYECSALPKGWIREEVMRKGGVSAGKFDVYYYAPGGKPKLRSKPELIKFLGDSFDLSCFDYGTGTMHSTLIKPRGKSIGGGKKTSKEKLKKVQTDAETDALKVSKPVVHSLVPPIRQTASIFKQPVTVVRRKEEETKVKSDQGKPGTEKPRQLFWEKRLQGLEARTESTPERTPLNLPSSIQRVSSVVGEKDRDTNVLLASISTALHLSNTPVVGQEDISEKLKSNPAAFLAPDQPLITAVKVNDDEISKQEERVKEARSRLAAAMKALMDC